MGRQPPTDNARRWSWLKKVNQLSKKRCATTARTIITCLHCRETGVQYGGTHLCDCGAKLRITCKTCAHPERTWRIYHSMIRDTLENEQLLDLNFEQLTGLTASDFRRWWRYLLDGEEGKVQIDHIKPRDEYFKQENPDVKSAFHYSNLAPMRPGKNWWKNNEHTPAQEAAWQRRTQLLRDAPNLEAAIDAINARGGPCFEHVLHPFMT